MDPFNDHPSLPVDTGCEIAASCLSCPLPRCRHDLAGGLQSARAQLKTLRRVAEIRRAGLTASAAAERYGLNKRTVYRWLRSSEPGE